ncbi:MAG: protein BatD, partial [Tidjanibacter sp.]|nr:protein BatD [Tidjanibacter sp.]
LFAFVGAAFADEVSFEVNVPRVVAVGEPFRVEFTLNANASLRDFDVPTFEGFDVVAGPSTSSSNSVQIINGHTTRTVTTTFNFVVLCPSEGDYNIGEASVRSKGKTYTSKAVTVKAIVENGAAAQQGGAQQQSAAARLAEDDVLIVASADRTNVYKGEPVRVVFKVYTRVAMGVESQKVPSFNGFWTQRLNIDANRWVREEYGGKIYDACPIGEYLLFPQQSGQLTIDPYEMLVVARLQVQRRRSNDPFAEFFGGAQIEEVRRNVASKALTINVKPLPANAPASFSGAVGELEMTTTPPSDHIEANTAVTYTVRISGKGNLSMIQAPQIELPTSFEQYSVKSTESIQATGSGITGYRQFEYPMIARADGDFLIPAVEFTYFNPKLAKYVTLSSSELMVSVAPDANASSVGPTAALVSGIAKEDIKFLGRDIRFIKLGSADLRPQGRLFMFSGLWWLIVVAMVAVAAVLGVWLKGRLKELRNQEALKGKRANKVALMRFRAAEKYMKEQNQKGFYEEMLRGLWGYLGDKLNISAADLTKESIRERLARKGVESEDVERYVSIISDCEYAQYAPSVSGQMEEAYLAGVEIISSLESVINK